MAKAFLTAFGGAGTVTGSQFLVEYEGKRYLVDCGLLQDGPDPEKENAAPFPFDPHTIDVLFVTHAHMDHVGRIPKLVAEGFSGKIISTSATRDLSRLMLDDAVSVFRDRYHRHQSVPLYRADDVEMAFSRWEILPYHERVSFGHDLFVQFLDAGHILGSAMVDFSIQGESLVLTGDLGNSPSPLLRPTEELDGVRYLLMESVYGDRNHEERTDRHEKLATVVKEVISRQSTLLIPAFSLERTQVILSELNELVEGGVVPAIPVFLDSPLAIRVTQVYRQHQDIWNDAARARVAVGDDPFSFPRLRFTPQHADSTAIAKVAGAKIIIAGSGMSTGGRVLSHEKLYLPDPKTIMLLVGYQSARTLGRSIADGDKQVMIDGEMVPVRATVYSIGGYSSHKDRDRLVEFVEPVAESVKKVFIAMGEPRASLFLAQRLRDYLGVEAVVPIVAQRYELDFP